jgi:hypothetical protein
MIFHVFFFSFSWVLGSDRFSLIQGTVQVSKFHFSIFGQTWVVSTDQKWGFPGTGAPWGTPIAGWFFSWKIR